MATASLRLLRECLPRSVIIALGRKGMDDLLAGLDLVDDILLTDKRLLLGPAKTASKIVPLRCDAALILPNSFSAAMAVRLANVPIRVGYDRDGRGLLLTHKLTAARRPPPHDGWAVVSAVQYYRDATRLLLATLAKAGHVLAIDPNAFKPVLELGVTESQDREALSILQRAGIKVMRDAGPAGTDRAEPFCVLNPGGNNTAKRWPIERFAALAHHLIERHHTKLAINGSPAEAEMVNLIKQAIVLNHPEDETMVASLPDLGGSIASLKGIVKRAALMVTNDTGPRHVAAAFNVPCVSLFGPTDPRWTTLPEADDRAREQILVADPTLPESELADDHPQRCRIDRISLEEVIAAVDRALGDRIQ